MYNTGPILQDIHQITSSKIYVIPIYFKMLFFLHFKTILAQIGSTGFIAEVAMLL